MGIGSPCTAYGTRRHWISIVVVTASAPALTFERSTNPYLSRAEQLCQNGIRTRHWRARLAKEAPPVGTAVSILVPSRLITFASSLPA